MIQPAAHGIAIGRFAAAVILLCSGAPAEPLLEATPPPAISGIYPHLAMQNDENECGTGAVVPWAGRLWTVTYAPHKPQGSTDKLYEITADLQQIVRAESVGGTPANRMIHEESQQLLIGPYLIDARGHVRVLPPSRMPGRLTGTARHLTAPASRVYYATMEEGFYDVDVTTLEVRQLYQDANSLPDPAGTLLPGYHGKGFFSGQGRLVYANNGELSPEAQRRPDIASGCLAEWRGGEWQVVRRNQFTEVTGPGGIRGNAHPATDPLWSVGWDHRSLILMLLDGGAWHTYRLPKASHAYDGAHGWNTEWPRIRDIGEDDLLMTMHGSFWRFPRGFTAAHSAGIAPRSTYLKVIGDFCEWKQRVVFGCDDTARSEFLNQRKAKGQLAGPGRSQSNLWFVDPGQLDHLGPALGRGAVWLQEPVPAGTPSDPFLFSGFAHRGLHLAHTEPAEVTFTLQVDRRGDGTWQPLRSVDVPARGSVWIAFGPTETGAWIRLIANRACTQATAMFTCRAKDPRPHQAAPRFKGLARSSDASLSGGLLHARGGTNDTLRFIARNTAGDLATYDLDRDLRLRRTHDLEGSAWTRTNVAIPQSVIAVDAASVLYVDDRGRWRLPLGEPAMAGAGPLGRDRVCREVCTERDLFNAGGTFYELPAENAGGFAKIRPIATHNRRIHDYASYRGLLVLSGVAEPAVPGGNPHLVRSDDGRCALWVGAVDDLWQLGKPRGQGGPWRDTPVEAGQCSDPYLMTGYDHKSLSLKQTSANDVRLTVEVDLTGEGCWVEYRTFKIAPRRTVKHRFPDAFSAYWVRLRTDSPCTVTAQFTYN